MGLSYRMESAALPCGGFEAAFEYGEARGYVKVQVRDGYACCTDIWAEDKDSRLFLRVLRFTLQKVKDLGFSTLFAHLTVGQERLKELYEKHGVAQVGYVMAKEL